MQTIEKLLSKIAFLTLALAPHGVQAQWSEKPEGQLVLRGGWLFDGVSDARRPNDGIVIKDGVIVTMDVDDQQQYLENARTSSSWLRMAKFTIRMSY